MSQYGNHCIHYTGIQMFRDKKCKAEVDILKFNGGERTGLFKNIPCLKSNNCSETCDKIRFPTKEDIEAHDKEWDAVLDRIKKLNPLIARLKKEHPRGDMGRVDCPNCDKKILWSISKLNGHIHMRCDTPDCVYLME